MLDLRTVYECNRCLGCKTLHPQVGIINLENPSLEEDAVKFEFYAVLLIEDCPGGCCCCGRKYYDYSNATMVFLTPGEIFRMSKENTLPDKGYLLAFHPDLLFRTSLKNHIKNYTFFHYRKEEALHLSRRETEKVTCCLSNIEDELHHPIDTHSSIILSRHIELLLDYCMRFYERQFVTRSKVNKDILVRFEEQLDAYFQGGRPQSEGLPTVKYFADRMNLSPNYFGDLVKKETGRTAQEYTQGKLIEVAKQEILGSSRSVSEIAYRLGFQYPQHFTRIFKKSVGCTPTGYRDLQV